MSTRSTLPAATLATIALVGCGGSSTPSLSSFKSGFKADKVQFSQLGVDLGTAIQGARSKSNTQISAEFSSLAARTTQQAAQLRKLNPPSQYKKQVDELASDLDAVAADMHDVASAANTNNGGAARAASTKLLQDATTTKSVDQSLTSKLGLAQTK